MLLEALLQQMSEWADQGLLEASIEPFQVVDLIGVLIAREPSFIDRALDLRFFSGVRGARRLELMVRRSFSLARERTIADRILATLPASEPVSAASLMELYLAAGHDVSALERVVLDRATTDPQFAAAIARDFVRPLPEFLQILAVLARHSDPWVRDAGIAGLLRFAKQGQGIPTTAALRRAAETLDPDAPDLFPEQREAIREFRAMMLSTPSAAPASAQPANP